MGWIGLTMKMIADEDDRIIYTFLMNPFVWAALCAPKSECRHAESGNIASIPTIVYAAGCPCTGTVTV